MNKINIYQLGLSFINGIGSQNAKKLLAYTGGVEAIFKEKKQNLLKIPGIGKCLANEVENKEAFSKAEEELKFIEKHGIKTYFISDKDYPQRLKQCEDAPILLYYKGHGGIEHAKVLSIVGTRKATQYGIENCKNILSELTKNDHDILIVSGLAYGIDVAAHKNALKFGQKTVAVLGHGLNMIYPAAHKKVAKDIIQQGGLLTELPSSARLDPGHFVKRNRIIAGLADATIVIESAKKGGSLITAKIANSYNRDVFALPGKINDKYSQGCNYLIRTNQAALIESAADIEYIMGWKKHTKNKAIQTKLFVDLNNEEKLVLDLLKERGKTAIDSLSVLAKLPVSKVSTILLKLEFSGAVISFPGKTYSAS